MSRNAFNSARAPKKTTRMRRKDRIWRAWKKIVAVAAGLGLVLTPLVGVVGAANAAGSQDYLALHKSVSGGSGVDVNNLKPGQAFTYTIDFSCSEVANGCSDAQLTDALPAALQGYKLVSFEAPSAIPNTVTWSENGSSIEKPSIIGPKTQLSIKFTSPLNNDETGDDANGIITGKSDSLTLTLQVPDDFSPTDSRNNEVVTNTATIKASNSDPASDSANITPNVARTIDAFITKAWSPATDSFNPGNASTITLTGKNTSNVPVDKLVIQDPQASDAPDGTASLSAANPFTITDFDGFDSTALPSGATTVQVDVYKKGDDGKYSWVTGTPSSIYQLPAGVTNADVAGLRYTYAGGDIAVNAVASPQIKLVQRSTNRSDGSDLSTATHSVTNVASAQTFAGSDKSDVKTDKATYTVNPAQLGAKVTKSINPERLPQGSSAQAELAATNTGSPVQTMTISDYTPDNPFFTTKVTFGGFSTSGINYPDGATSGKVIYYLASGGTQEVPFADGAQPADPSSAISGFDVVFSSTGNDIPNNAQTKIDYTINTANDAPLTTTTNDVKNTVKAANGQTASDTDSDTLTPVAPSIKVSLDKKIKPTTAITPGQPSVVSLTANTSSESDFVKPNSMVVEDSWGANGSDKSKDYWNAFNVTSVLPTQIPAGSDFKVEVQLPDGSWATIDTATNSTDAATLYSLSSDAFATKLSAAAPGITPAQLTGIRFNFTKTTGTYPASTTVAPNIGFVARATLRDGSGPTDTTHDASAGTPYTDNANVVGTGTTPSGNTLTGDDKADAPATVWIPKSGPCSSSCVDIAKAWAADSSNTANGSQAGGGASVDAQSQETRITHLNWSTTTGLKEVQITDPNAPSDVSKTVFDAFNLVSIPAISSRSTPYTNGWYLKYDTISKIELYIDGNWTEVTAPTGGWQTSSGSFVGYTLTSAQQGDLTGADGATGVRITLVPNDAARQAALDDGTDIYAPAVGSGVASASQGGRQFDLQWQLRNQTRSTGAWVTSSAALNNGDGSVDNKVGITGTTSDNKTVADTADATISVLDQPAGVAVQKAVTPNNGTTTNQSTPLVVPAPGSGGGLPTATYTITANNTSTTSAQYVKVVDPSPCDDTSLANCQTENSAAGAQLNPFSNISGSDIDTTGLPNPFNRLDVTGVTVGASIPSQVDLTQSTAWLLKYDASASAETNRYTVDSMSASALNGLSATDLENVVGIAVTFQGSNPAQGGTITSNNKLTITIATRVRSTLRDTGTSQDITKPTQAVNRTFAQSYDAVTQDVAKPTGDMSDATVNLTSGSLDVNPTKTISGGTITEPNRHDPRTVTLSANQGTSTTYANKVVLSDASTYNAGNTTFWNDFEFTGLKSATPITFPNGANQVQIDAYGDFGDGAGWTDGSPQAVQSTGDAYTLPISSDDYSKVTGLRFTFTRADGKEFSTTTPNWSANAAFTVQLRDSVPASTADTVFGGSATDTMTAQSFGVNSQSNELPSSADIAWNSGSHELQLNKLANNGSRSVAFDKIVPWDITVKNSGTGTLNVSSVVDTFPSTLKFVGTDADGTEPGWTFSPDNTSGSTLTSTPSLVPSEGKLTFTWPDGNTMQPGETAHIRVWFLLAAGTTDPSYCVGSANPAGSCNEVTVNTVQSLDKYGDTNTTDGSAGVVSNSPTSVSTSDYVTPTPTTNLSVYKGVIGSLNGATSSACVPSLTVDGADYYRPPCVANSTMGGVDRWALSVVNTSTQSVKSAVLFDQLPIVGDSLLVSGNDRGTQYRPQMLDDLKVVGAPAGTVQTVEVTMASSSELASGDAGDNGVCANGSWQTLPAGEPCVSNGETWVPASSLGADGWAKVTGLRISLDFTQTALGGLPSGGALGVTYSSQNVPTTSDVAGAATDIPVTDTQAWNQFGLKWQWADGSYRTLAPNKVGVHLRTGSIAVEKTANGDAAGTYAPAEVTANVTCTAYNGQTLTFDGGLLSKTVKLEKQDDGSYAPVVISGIPLGPDGSPTQCSVVEDGDLGHFGETARSSSPADGNINVTTADPTTGAVSASDVPTTQIAALTNTYSWSGLSVTKKVDTQATVGSFGPFTFTLRCTVKNGDGDPTPVQFDGEDSTSFTIAAGKTWKAPADTIPAGANCVLTETDSAAADSTVITGDNVVDNGVVKGNPQATITVGKDATNIVSTLVTNHYDAGTFTVTKKVDGNGADLYGSGPFTFNSICTYKDQTLLDETFSLGANESKTFGVFPAGTACDTTETKTGGANASTMDPADGKIIIEKQTPVDAGDDTSDVPPLSSVDVTATNTFNVGSLQINKVRAGDGADLYGAGPFTAQVKCTWDKDGVTTPVTLANGGLVELNAANAYAATLDNLPVGASCNVNETKSGGATSSSLDPGDGNVTITDSTTSPVAVTITNTFDVGLIKITKKRVGPGANVLGNGPFAANVKCTRDVDGVDTPVTLPDSGNVTLSKDNGYEATVLNVPIGSSCSIVETVKGKADKVTIDHPTVELSATYPRAYVTITNHFPTVHSKPGSNSASPSPSQLNPSSGSNSDNQGTSGKGGLATTGLGIGALLAAVAALLSGAVLLIVSRRRKRN